jgi:transposase
MGLAPLEELVLLGDALTCWRHLLGLLSYLAHPITNAGAEGLNSRIQAVRAIRISVGDYRNR